VWMEKGLLMHPSSPLITVEDSYKEQKYIKQGIVTHTCNPSYSRGRNWEDHI
jgi:hypothetical protein